MSVLVSHAEDVKAIAVLGYFAAGTTTRTSTVVDTQNYDGVEFVLHLGTVTDASVVTLTLKENTANSTSSPTPVTPTGLNNALTAATSSNTIMRCQIYRPLLRYVFAVVTIATQNAELLGIVAYLYGGRVKPVTQDATVAVAITVKTGI